MSQVSFPMHIRQNLLRSLNLISIRSRLKPVFHPWFGQCPSLEACHFWKVWRTVVKGLCHIPSSVFVGWNFFKCGKSHIFAARWHFLCHWNKGSKQVFYHFRTLLKFLEGLFKYSNALQPFTIILFVVKHVFVPWHVNCH